MKKNKNENNENKENEDTNEFLEKKDEKVKTEKTSNKKNTKSNENKDNKKKKVKLKHKKIIIVILFIVFLLIGGLSYYLYDLNQKNTEKLIKRNYNKYVITTKKINLYDKNKKVIGTIDKDYKLELEEIKNLSIKNKYFKINNTDNYIGYKDIKKTKEFKNEINIGNYVIFNKNIKGSNIDLKNDNKTIIKLNSINLPILYMDKDNYYISFLNNSFSVKKDKSIKEVDNKNTDDKSNEYVSVLYYESISNNCEVTNCFDETTVNSHINVLKENGYYFITKDEYIKYINNYLRLKEKAVLLLAGSETDEVKKINNDLGVSIGVISDTDGIKFEDTNKKSTVSDDHNKLNRYAIKYYSTIENILKMANGEDVYEEEPPKKAERIAVLNYHFFYDPATQTCDETICLKVDRFREHLQYLKDNEYKTLTMNEFVNWIYGRIELPEKSVLITIDDGAMGTGRHNGNHLATILNEFKMHATLFLIAGWWDISNYRDSEYLEIQSHTYDMHLKGPCGQGQLVCANYDTAKEDIQKSLDIIGDNTSFCYPFYQYDDEAIRAIKDLGFKVAFAGGNVKASRNSNKYTIPRFPILSDHTAGDIARMVG